jgi:von Hippel-Lindau disease tumor supressor
MIPQRQSIFSLFALVLLAALAPCVHADKKHLAEEKGIKSIDGGIETSITFVNNSKQTIRIFWLNYEGKRTQGKIVKEGDSLDLTSTLGHVFLVTDKVGNGWYVYVADAQPRIITIEAPK